MPLHLYHCTNCAQFFEEIQKFSDPPLTTCAQCGGALEKQRGKPAFHLKGGGWYRDGYTANRTKSDTVKKTKDALVSSSD